MKIRNALIQREGNRTQQPSYLTNRRIPSNIYVDHYGALSLVPVWSAVRLICETIGVLSWHLFQRTTDAGKSRRDDLYIDKVLRSEPNPEMSATTFREVWVAHALLYGNGYAEIERDNAGRPIGLWPLLPDRMQPWRIPETNELVYIYRMADGIEYVMKQNDVLHLRGLGYDGIRGYDVVSTMARALGTHTAADVYAGAFFGNGAQLGGALVVKSAKPLSPETKEEIRREIFREHGGAFNAFGTGIFEGDWDWKQMGIAPEAAQLIETRKFTVNDIARMFRVPPHKIGELERATFSNIEEQNIDWVVDGVLPWVTRIEQEADRKLLTWQLKLSGHFTRLNLQTLLRGKLQDRYAAYEKGRMWGWLSANDVREMEDLDPLPDEIGNMYLVPLNYQPADMVRDSAQSKITQANQPKQLPAPDNNQNDATNAAARELVLNTFREVMTREYNALRDVAGKHQYAVRIRKAVDYSSEHLHKKLDGIAKAMATLLNVEREERIDMVKRVVGMYRQRQTEAWIEGGEQVIDNECARWVDEFMTVLIGGK